MRFSLQREVFLKPLAQVVNVVERRQTLPVLANLLVQVKDGQLSLTGTDLEVEMVARHAVDDAQDGETTIPARKLFEIVRALPDGSKVTVIQTGDKITVQAGRTRFTLASLPANDFPSIDEVEATERVRVPEAALKELIERTAFAMAQQDVRYYLNGLLFDLREKTPALRGHRRPSPGAVRGAARRRRPDQAPDHRAAQGRAGAAAPAGRRRSRAGAGDRPQPHPGQARRCDLHQQADRRPLPGLRGGDPDRRRPGGADRPRGPARGAAARGDPVQREVPRRAHRGFARAS